VDARVWMVHGYSGARRGIRGRLSLDSDTLRFVPEVGQRGVEMTFPLERVAKVDQAFQSPVLELELSSGDVSEVLFYFSEPPFMYGRGTLVTLALADGLLHGEISRWVEAISAASGG
jgi:hypothetical protein